MNININRLTTESEKMLYMILTELKEINSKLSCQEPQSEALCQLCGKDHSNKGYALACAKKHGKGGVKK